MCSAVLRTESNRQRCSCKNVFFWNWVKISDTLATHAKHKYHSQSMQEAETLKTTVDNSDTRLDVMVSTALQDRLATNKHVIIAGDCAFSAIFNKTRSTTSWAFTNKFLVTVTLDIS